MSLGAKGHGCAFDACRVGHKKAENIETLFQLYDMLEADCQDTLKGGRTVPSKEAATATQLLDELRNRFVRLVQSQLTCFSAHTIFCICHQGNGSCPSIDGSTHLVSYSICMT